MDARLPTHVVVSGLIRAIEATGGFATVLAKGERDGGTLALVVLERGGPALFYERMPQLDGSRSFVCTRSEEPAEPLAFRDYLSRRRQQDPDLWLLEADVPDSDRFVASLPT